MVRLLFYLYFSILLGCISRMEEPLLIKLKKKKKKHLAHKSFVCYIIVCVVDKLYYTNIMGHDFI